jgi:hypothetical protein
MNLHSNTGTDGTIFKTSNKNKKNKKKNKKLIRP